ncbi:MAG: secretin N-terminal domain-containing protein, partial [Pirellulaceae bacterium]
DGTPADPVRDRTGGTRGGGELTTKAYPVKWANTTTIRSALMSVVPKAMISSDARNKMLVVTANEEDHAKIEDVLDQADRRGGGDLTTKAYSLRKADPDSIMDALEPVVPDATISADTENRMLVVTASADDHERVQGIVDEADGRGEGDLVTEAYSLKWSDPGSLVTVLEPIVPDAIIAADQTNSAIVVTGSAIDQELVQKVIDQADRRGEGEMTTEVYLLTRANPSYVQRALQPLVPNATIGADVTSKTLIVTAPEEDQTKIEKIVEQADRRGEGKLTTKVYAFKLADPDTVAEALGTLIPNAQMSADPSTNTLIVTGTTEDHAQVEPLVEQLDVASPSTSILKPYTVKNAEAEQVYQALSQIFSSSRDISIGYQDKTGMIMAYAPAAQQDEVEQAILAIDEATAKRPEATLKVYELEGVDVTTAVDTVRSLLEDETPKIDLQSDMGNNQILAIAEPQQHELIENAISQLKPVKREMEVFTLGRMDPYSAQLAINTMFGDLPFAAMPMVEADPDMRQLIVHATEEQLKRIRELLDKMGEGDGGPGRRRDSTSLLRVIPFTGDVAETLREIERIWPQVRGNQIEIVSPRGESESPPEPQSTPSADEEASEQGEQESSTAVPGNEATENAQADEGDASSASEEKPAGNTDKAAALASPATMLVSAQDPNPESELPPAPEMTEESQATEIDPPTSEPSEEPKAQEGEGEKPDQQANEPEPAEARQRSTAAELRAAIEARRGRETNDQPAADEGAPEKPPIVIIAGDDRLTVASRDAEALNMFEQLLETLQQGTRLSFSKGNFSMFMLENADAEEIAETLNSLFGRNARSSQRRYGAYRRRSQTLRVVADDRMNALLVYGSVSERDMVEEMLPLLDSAEIPESLSTEKPRMISVENLPAETVLQVLESVYDTQLSARRGLRPVTIPRGISPEMTSMLELLNATANAPILTLDVDETTNSIVMRAPRKLGEEIEGFIKELDEQAREGGTQSISLVPLEGTNSEQIRGALQMLMRGGRSRRFRGR